MYFPPGFVIFVAVEGTFVHFTKGHDHFISNSIRCGCLRQNQCNIACREAAYRNALAILAVVTLRGGNELRLLIYAVRVCRLPSLFFYNVSLYFVFKEVVRYAARRMVYSFAAEVHDFPHW